MEKDGAVVTWNPNPADIPLANRVEELRRQESLRRMRARKPMGTVWHDGSALCLGHPVTAIPTQAECQAEWEAFLASRGGR